MWFEKLSGFAEVSATQVRENFRIDGPVLCSEVNGRQWIYGTLGIPTLAELREQVSGIKRDGKLTLREVVASVQDLHLDASNAGALFQVASQFNLLEMSEPSITPENGIDIYENDHTQGPSCAIAAGAGTIYRNYFAQIDGKVGQTAERQIDCLADLGGALGNNANRLWRMQNGYALATRSGLNEINDRLSTASESERDDLRKCLRIGIQWHTQVTLEGAKHTLTQAYCSALPVAYSHLPAELWEHFAQLVLEASYEATFCAALLNAKVTGNTNLFLTFLGGGVFGNDRAWIRNAIQRSLGLFRDHRLDVAVVSHGKSNPMVEQMLQR
jgi:hypothetical protein